MDGRSPRAGVNSPWVQKFDFNRYVLSFRPIDASLITKSMIVYKKLLVFRCFLFFKKHKEPNLTLP